MNQIFIQKKSKRTALVSYALLLWCILFFLGIMSYEGAKASYGVFSLGFLCLLITALQNPLNYSYLFFSVFLWLGFWLKFTLHTVLNYDYREPTGSFLFESDSIDAVLMISTIGCLGVLSARYLAHQMKLRSTLKMDNAFNPFPLYRAHRTFFLILLISSSVVLSLLNGFLGIYQIGMVPTLILQWPLNAVISWALSIGFALFICTFLNEDIFERKNISYLMAIPLIEGFCTSVSILSRSLYICHITPLIVAFLVNDFKRLLSLRAIRAFAVLFLLLFFISLHSVTLLRNYYYLGQPPWHAQESRLSKSKSLAASQYLVKSVSVVGEQLSLLMADRWIGIEGLMAVSAYPEKNIKLLTRGLLEKAQIGQVSVFQAITQSSYAKMDAKRFAFATLPGPIAFLFYSGSVSIVFLGMFGLTLFLMSFEVLVSRLTHNFLLCALVGMDIAFLSAQLGVTPRLFCIHLFLIVCYCLFIFFLTTCYHKLKRSRALADLPHHSIF